MAVLTLSFCRVSCAVKRDIAERGRSVDDVLHQYLYTVKPAFDEFIAPVRRHRHSSAAPSRRTPQCSPSLLPLTSCCPPSRPCADEALRRHHHPARRGEPRGHRPAGAAHQAPAAQAWSAARRASHRRSARIPTHQLPPFPCLGHCHLRLSSGRGGPRGGRMIRRLRPANEDIELYHLHNDRSFAYDAFAGQREGRLVALQRGGERRASQIVHPRMSTKRGGCASCARWPQQRISAQRRLRLLRWTVGVADEPRSGHTAATATCSPQHTAAAHRHYHLHCTASADIASI